MQASQDTSYFAEHCFPSFQTDFKPGRNENLSVFPQDDLLAKEIESWKLFGETLRSEDRKMFNSMVRQCYKHIRAINAKGESSTTESFLMSLLLIQHQMIDFLINSRR